MSHLRLLQQLLIWPALLVACMSQSSREIEYRGERIALSKSYSDFDEYKDDPNNIAAFETARVQRLVLTAPIGRRFATLLDASGAVGKVAFPGYGSGGTVVHREADGTLLQAYHVEVPRAEKERWFVFRGKLDRFDLIDDFVMPDGPIIREVKRDGNTLLFLSRDSVVFTRPFGPLGRQTSP